MNNRPETSAPLQSARDLKKETPAFLYGAYADQLAEAQKMPPLRYIMKDFLYENDLCIIFGGPNIGKTILNTQIAEMVGSGKGVGGFASEVLDQPIILDLEMDARKLARRYARDQASVYSFSKSIIRMYQNRDFIGRLKAQEKIEQAIDLMREYDSKILIVDNFSAMGVDHEKSQDALELMRTFRQVTAQVNGTVIVAAHTPKRSGNEILQLKDLAGSAVISNFADSVIGIGQDARSPNRRYLKGFKNRDVEKKFAGPQVLECEIRKADNGLVYFERIGTAFESQMLVSDQEAEKMQRNNDISQLKADGMSLRDIAKKLDISLGAVQYALKNNSQNEIF